ncbi:MAG: Uma2 family endonuclease [Actinobacteria bacterium]|nr:Uma2 family endonuclease [Actinomycetota bacterium]
MYVDERNVPEPDVVFVGPDKVDGSERRYLKAVDLVVEVSSPPTRRLDLLRKRALYERFGVPEYRRPRCRSCRHLQARREVVRRPLGRVPGGRARVSPSPRLGRRGRVRAWAALRPLAGHRPLAPAVAG